MIDTTVRHDDRGSAFHAGSSFIIHVPWEAIMQAMGFGQRVTGGGGAAPIMVTTTGTGDGSLAEAIDRANERSADDRNLAQRIVIDIPGENKVIAQNTDALVVTARNLTIEAAGGATIDRNYLVFNCRKADNIILRDLSFRGTGKGKPRDTIFIDATKGRGPIGFWIDHCFFSAYFDLSITLNAKDLDDASKPPLLMTVSSCHFYDAQPSGCENRNHGALGLHGFTDSDDDDDDDGDGEPDRSGRNRRTNAYVTVHRNCFDHIRRRSPRSSGLTLVHAFNNVVLKWGSDAPTDDQQNGMEVGHDGRMVAEANYFEHNVLTEAISVSRTFSPRLTVPASGPRQNVYDSGTVHATTVGTPIIISEEYDTALTAAGLAGSQVIQPDVLEMTGELRSAIITEAGLTDANKPTAGANQPAAGVPRASTA